MPKEPESKEPASEVVPATEWDGEPMKYEDVPATDRDGNPVQESAGKPAGGKQRGPAAEPKEN